MNKETKRVGLILQVSNPIQLVLLLNKETGQHELCCGMVIPQDRRNAKECHEGEERVALRRLGKAMYGSDFAAVALTRPQQRTMQPVVTKDGCSWFVVDISLQELQLLHPAGRYGKTPMLVHRSFAQSNIKVEGEHFLRSVGNHLLMTPEERAVVWAVLGVEAPAAGAPELSPIPPYDTPAGEWSALAPPPIPQIAPPADWPNEGGLPPNPGSSSAPVPAPPDAKTIVQRFDAAHPLPRRENRQPRD